MSTLQDVLDAAANERLIIKVARSWWAARITLVHHFGDDWIVQVRGGPGTARGIITNIDQNAYGREFHII